MSTIVKTPYRTSDLILKTKKTSGFLSKPKDPPAPKVEEHNCNLPFLFMRSWFFWLPQVEVGDLWRCPQCKRIHELCRAKVYTMYSSPKAHWSLKPKDKGIELWKEMGGDE